jgi:hypothetical protein
MSMYAQFQTDGSLEQSGVWLDYGEFKVKISRAGGANKKFVKLLEQRTKPFRRAMQTETMNNDKAMEILRGVYAATIVMAWETKVDGEFAPGIEPPEEGEKLLPFNIENVAEVFNTLPDLFADIQEQSNKVAIFREELLESDSGN